MPRKPHEPSDKDRKQVTVMAGIGLTHDQIAKVLGISDETLRKYYGNELETAEALMNAQVAQNLFSIATSKGTGSVAAAIFWLARDHQGRGRGKERTERQPVQLPRARREGEEWMTSNMRGRS
jgi:hypothetical protein